MSVLGYWREPEGTPQGNLVWQPPSKTGGLPTYVGLINGKTVATIRNKGRGLGYLYSARYRVGLVSTARCSRWEDGSQGKPCDRVL